MVVLANGTRRRLQRRRWLTHARWTSQHGERGRYIDLYICLLEDLIEQGPFAPIFTSNHADELVDWLGDPPPDCDEPDEEEVEPHTDAEEEPAVESDLEPPGDPEPEVQSDAAGAAFDRDDDDGLLPLLGSEPADDERDRWGRW